MIKPRSEIKNNGYCGIKISNAEPIIEENVITNNWYGVYSPSSTKTPVLKNNSIYANRYLGVTARNIWNGILSGHIDARDNWWGSDSGPTHKSNPGGDGDAVSNNVTFNPWLGKDTNDGTPDPAIIIPGIMGSWEKDGAWQIDPIFHTYDNLIEAFVAAVRDTIESDPALSRALLPMLYARQVLFETFMELDRRVRKAAHEDEVCTRFMGIPGDGRVLVQTIERGRVDALVEWFAKELLTR